MSELTEGERQRREVNSYNLFLSAATPRAEPSLKNRGVCVPLVFPTISDRSGDVEVSPDFVLYDGYTCGLVELKSGNNITGRHIRQMRDCNRVDIEGVEEALADAQVSERTKYDGNVRVIEPIIVYHDMDEDYIEETASNSQEFQGILHELLNHCVLMTQDFGGELRVLRGEFNDPNSDLQALLKTGIQLPENPPDKLLLTESMEPEILAIAISEVWGDQVVSQTDPVRISRAEVRDFFAPQHNVSPSELDLVFEFLEEVGACETIDENVYEFRREHMEGLLQVENTVLEQTVEDYLYGEEQTGLDDFSQ